MSNSGVCEKLRVGDFWYKLDSSGGEAIAEAAVSVLLGHLGIPHVQYRVHPDCLHVSVSKDFTGGSEFVSIDQVLKLNGIFATNEHLDSLSNIGNGFAWESVIYSLKSLGLTENDIVNNLSTMVFIDHIVGNIDRHTGNYGILASAKGYKFAPYFDFGRSLGVPETSYMYLSPQTFHSQIIYNEYLKPYNGMPTPQLPSLG